MEAKIKELTEKYIEDITSLINSTSVNDRQDYNTSNHTSKNGTVRYFKGCLLHREDGPAEIKSNGHQYYYNKGKYHRLDGPAYIADDKFYFIEGKKYTREDYLKHPSVIETIMAKYTKDI